MRALVALVLASGYLLITYPMDWIAVIGSITVVVLLVELVFSGRRQSGKKADVTQI